MPSRDFTHSRWRVSARTNGDTTCVEATTDGSIVAVQNSTRRYPDGPMLTVSARSWLSFLDDVAVGLLDRATLSSPAVSGPFTVTSYGGLVELRHADEPSGPCVRYTPAEWDVFVSGVTEDGEFTLEWLLRPSDWQELQTTVAEP